MRKRIMIITALVLGLVGPVLAAGPDPSLMGYWEFEGNWLDSSGNNRTGVPSGNAQFGPGLNGQGLLLDGSGDYVTITGYKGILGGNPFTITAWVKSTDTGDATMVNWGSSTNGQRVDFRLYQGRLRVEHGNGNLQGNTPLNNDEWHHVACVVGPNASIQSPDVLLYLDGKNDSQTTTDPDKFNIAAVTDVTIGRRGTNSDRAMEGTLDEVRIYDRALTAEEIKALAAHPRAFGPSPADGTQDVTGPLFTWQPRETALWHDVYLGTDPNLGTADLVAPHLIVTLYWHLPGLTPGTTYYWRVDEVDPDGTIHAGDVWTFLYPPLNSWQPDPTEGESYVDPDVTLSWMKGGGAISHDVYFGLDPAAVAEGAADTFQGNQLAASFPAGPLEWNTPYYWRVDEVGTDGTKIQGNVWTFRTLPEIAITDPNLVCWWKIDEGVGTRVVDWSGHGNHGEFEGDPQWVEGYDGYALEFDGIDDAVVKSLGAATDWPAFTVSLWVKAAFLGQVQYRSPYSGHYPNTAGFQIDVDGTDPGSYRVNPSGLIFGAVTTEWVHLALTATGTAAKLYYNGIWTATGTLNDAMFNQVAIGRNRNIDNRFAGAIDDVRVFNRELVQDEIDLLMRIDPLRAWQPSPADASMADIRTATPLTWTKGDNAAKHDVYFGTEAAAVADANTSDATGVYRSRISATSFTPAEDLPWGQKYFWRVDEVNTDGTVTPGKVWSFTVADYLIVDDFESYNDLQGSRIYETWIDGWTNGTGSVVGNVVAPFAERTIVYSGRQSMPLDYNNINTPWYSEAELEFSPVQNWTFGESNTLVVHFQGAPVDFLESAGAITLSAAGTDIWNTVDEFRYVFKRLTGDGSIVARVDSITNTNVWAKGGVMIRESLDPSSRQAMVVVTPGSGVAFQRRLVNNDVSVGTTEAGIVAPHWVKLTRTGNLLTAQHSADGVTWSDVVNATNPTSDTVVMGGTIYIGLALTSHAANVACTAVFSEIKTTGNVTGSWQQAEVGADHPGNSAQGLYVGIEDSAGKAAFVTHPDPAPATIGAWTEWAIPLSSFTGVNPAKVKKMYVGVGDRQNPVPDGTGRIYIDDIRVTKGIPQPTP
jgi:hypothetical protein